MGLIRAAGMMSQGVPPGAWLPSASTGSGVVALEHKNVVGSVPVAYGLLSDVKRNGFVVKL